MFECSRTALAAALAAIKPAAQSGNTIPILQNVCVEHSGGELMVRGNCLDFELIARIPATFEPAFVAFTCQADLFLRFVNAAPKETIRVEATTGEAGLNGVLLRSGNTRLRLFVLDAKGFPTLDLGDLPHSFTLTGHILTRPLQAVAYAVSADKDRRFLQGVRFDGGADGLALVALDGKRMEYRRVPAASFDEDVDLASLPKVTIPTASVKHMLSMIRKEEDVTVQLSEARARVIVGNVVFCTKLVEEEFPDYHRLIPQGNHIRVTIERDRLDNAIERVMLATKDATKGAAFRFEVDALTLRTYDHEVGDAEDKIEIEASEALEIGFNGRFMRDILAHMEGDVAEILLLERSKPALIRPLGDDVNFSVLYAMNMPVMPR